MVEYFPCEFYGLYVGHPELLPFFLRHKILDDIDFYQEDEPELAKLAQLPIQEYAAAVADGFPVPFGDTALHDGIEQLAEFDGVFIPLEQLIPEGEKECLQDGGLSKLSWEDEPCFALYRPLQQRPGLFQQAYGSPDEVLSEIRGYFAQEGIELPEHFPLWKYIGLFSGVQYQDS